MSFLITCFAEPSCHWVEAKRGGLEVKKGKVGELQKSDEARVFKYYVENATDVEYHVAAFDPLEGRNKMCLTEQGNGCYRCCPTPHPDNDCEGEEPHECGSGEKKCWYQTLCHAESAGYINNECALV